MSAEQNKGHKEKRGFLELLAVKAELPSDVLGSDFRVELRGRNTLFMQGCRRILKYSPDEMIMSARGFAVVIEGERLICSTYHGGTVTVEGNILAVRFDLPHDEEKNK
ncbi:MAG: YabP/YqfC family sporulation protein [Clostridia bacterium]|nr:YabP/YqfC family sporulation protein [Clostridia bacterium]